MSDDPPAKPASLIAEEFAPVAFRVWWRHHDSKLVSTKRPPEAFRDFPTEEEAAEFKQSMQASHPYSVVSSKPIHVTHRKREARYDARQYNAAAATAAQATAMSGLMPARERARLLRREISQLLGDARSGRIDLLVNAERIRRVADELCEVEEQLADDELVAP